MLGQRKTVPIEAINPGEAPYPLDEIFIERFQLYLQGTLTPYFALIQAAGIRPHSDYVPESDAASLASVQQSVNSDQPPAITVYPRDDFFVMSNDYSVFFAYLKLGWDAIPCHVLGLAQGPYVLYCHEGQRAA
jgi:hypothetical protein